MVILRNSKTSRSKAVFIAFLPLLLLCFVVASVALQGAFIAAHWDNLSGEGAGALAWAMAIGLRFNIAVVAYLFIPLTVLYCAALLAPKVRLLRYMFGACVVASAMLMSAFWLADIQ